MAYFTIMAELRGCYADNDSAWTLMVDTRRELKATLQSEANDLRDAGAVGLSKRAIGWLAAAAWKSRKSGSSYPHVAPFRYPHQSGFPMGLMVYSATRQDYLEARDGDS